MLAAGTAVGEMWCTRKAPSLQYRSRFRFILEDCEGLGTVLVVCDRVIILGIGYGFGC